MAQRFHSIRTIPKVVNYRNDGAGRDTYISFYNGGFGSYKLSDISPKERTESPKHYYHQNLALSKPAKRYFTDGGGRDLYVYNSLRDENDKCKGNLRLNNILRSYDNSKQYVRTSKNVSPSKFEKKLIDRIFYGKCPGLNDRLMSPKVKFLKKEDLRKSTEENEENEKNNDVLQENNDENNNNRYDKYGVSMTETGIKKNYTTGMDFVCELTYPVGESISEGLIMSSNQISGIIGIVIWNVFKVQFPQYKFLTNIMFIIMFFISLVSLSFMEVNLVRTKKDKGEDDEETNIKDNEDKNEVNFEKNEKENIIKNKEENIEINIEYKQI